jgi:hypothetical protein
MHSLDSGYNSAGSGRGINTDIRNHSSDIRTRGAGSAERNVRHS